MYKNSFVHTVSKVFVDVMFYGGIAVTLSMPWSMGPIFRYYGREYVVTRAYMAMAVILGICAVYLMFQLKQMFKTLLGGNPFVEKNVGCLRRIAVSCAVMALLFMAKVFVAFSMTTLAISVVFIIGTLFCLTLKDIFKQAIAFKEENDMTI